MTNKTAIWVFTSAAGIIWSGFVMAKLWAWFVAAVFNLPFLTVQEATGLLALGRFVIYPVMDTKESPSDLESWFIRSIIDPAAVLVFGFSITLWP